MSKGTAADQLKAIREWREQLLTTQSSNCGRRMRCESLAAVLVLGTVGGGRSACITALDTRARILKSARAFGELGLVLCEQLTQFVHLSSLRAQTVRLIKEYNIYVLSTLYSVRDSMSTLLNRTGTYCTYTDMYTT